MPAPSQQEIKDKLDQTLINTEAWSTDDPQLIGCTPLILYLAVAEQNLLLERILTALEAP